MTLASEDRRYFDLSGVVYLHHGFLRCPVCSKNLADLGPTTVQEDHVRTCLEGDSGPGLHQSGRYLVYKVMA